MELITFKEGEVTYAVNPEHITHIGDGWVTRQTFKIVMKKRWFREPVEVSEAEFESVKCVDINVLGGGRVRLYNFSISDVLKKLEG